MAYWYASQPTRAGVKELCASVHKSPSLRCPMDSPRTAVAALAALEAEIAQAQARLGAARSARDASHKQYLATVLAAEGVARELERLVKSRAAAQSAASAENEQVMAELGISFDGSRFWCGSRSYARLADAVSYARLLLGLPAHDPRIADA